MVHKVRVYHRAGLLLHTLNRRSLGADDETVVAVSVHVPTRLRRIRGGMMGPRSVFVGDHDLHFLPRPHVVVVAPRVELALAPPVGVEVPIVVPRSLVLAAVPAAPRSPFVAAVTVVQPVSLAAALLRRRVRHRERHRRAPVTLEHAHRVRRHEPPQVFLHRVRNVSKFNRKCQLRRVGKLEHLRELIDPHAASRHGAQRRVDARAVQVR